MHLIEILVLFKWNGISLNYCKPTVFTRQTWAIRFVIKTKLLTTQTTTYQNSLEIHLG